MLGGKTARPKQKARNGLHHVWFIETWPWWFIAFMFFCFWSWTIRIGKFFTLSWLSIGPWCRLFLENMVSSTELHEPDSSFSSRKRLKVLDFESEDQDAHVCLGNHIDIASSMQPTAEGCSSQRYCINYTWCPHIPTDFSAFVCYLFIVSLLKIVLQVCGSQSCFFILLQFRWKMYFKLRNGNELPVKCQWQWHSSIL